MVAENKNSNAWLMLTKDKRQHGGNLGYDDSASEYYSWDSTVPNHEGPAPEDKIVIWDGDTLLGASVIEHITVADEKKLRFRCPKCSRTNIKPRLSLTPRYRCHRGDCKHEFDKPISEEIVIKTYRCIHKDMWYDLQGQLNASQLRNICEQPKTQHSMRKLVWADFLQLLGSEITHNFANIDRSEGGSSGHRIAKTRVRIGQAKFRKNLVEKYGYTCAFSGPNDRNGLDAAHLYSYARVGDHDPYGGFLLRKDLHRFFDLGLLAVNPESMKIHLAEKLKRLEQYRYLDGAKLKVGIDSRTKKWLTIHWDEHSELMDV